MLVQGEPIVELVAMKNQREFRKIIQRDHAFKELSIPHVPAIHLVAGYFSSLKIFRDIFIYILTIFYSAVSQCILL